MNYRYHTWGFYCCYLCSCYYLKFYPSTVNTSNFLFNLSRCSLYLSLITSKCWIDRFLLRRIYCEYLLFTGFLKEINLYFLAIKIRIWGGVQSFVFSFYCRAASCQKAICCLFCRIHWFSLTRFNFNKPELADYYTACKNLLKGFSLFTAGCMWKRYLFGFSMRPADCFWCLIYWRIN